MYLRDQRVLLAAVAPRGGALAWWAGVAGPVLFQGARREACPDCEAHTCQEPPYAGSSPRVRAAESGRQFNSSTSLQHRANAWRARASSLVDTPAQARWVPPRCLLPRRSVISSYHRSTPCRCTASSLQAKPAGDAQTVCTASDENRERAGGSATSGRRGRQTRVHVANRRLATSENADENGRAQHSEHVETQPAEARTRRRHCAT